MSPIIFFLLVVIISSTDVGLIGYFQSPDCPEGWEPYIAINDKFILSSGNIYSVGNTGGEAQVKLVLQNMPPHNHADEQYSKILKLNCQWAGHYFNHESCGKLDLYHSKDLKTQGEGKPHNNMPPYFVLKACKKVNETKVDCTKQFISCDLQRFNNMEKAISLQDEGMAAFKSNMEKELELRDKMIETLNATLMATKQKIESNHEFTLLASVQVLILLTILLLA